MIEGLLVTLIIVIAVIGGCLCYILNGIDRKVEDIIDWIVDLTEIIGHAGIEYKYRKEKKEVKNDVG